jgi:sortase B
VKAKRIIYRFFIVVCALVFLFSLFQVVKILKGYYEAEKFYDDAADQYTQSQEQEQQEEEPEEKTPITVDLEALQKVNEDIIGWIYMEDTVVSYPILQGTNNWYYLDKTYEKKYLASGSIYLDSGSADDFSDAHSVIYGHNMRNHTMFGDLEWFKDEEYGKEHPYIYILLPEDHWLKYQIYSVYRADISEETDGTYDIPLNQEEDFQAFLDMTLEKRLYEEDLPLPTTEDRILTLSTCTDDRADQERFVLQAVLVEEG